MLDTLKPKVNSAEEELEPIGLEGEPGTKKNTRRSMKDYDTDIRNSELLIDAHSNDPFHVMRIQTYDDAPMALAGDDVVIRVEVSCAAAYAYIVLCVRV